MSGAGRDPVPPGVTRRLGVGPHLPVLRQTEASECGLACLAMVAAWHGLDIDLATLRQRFSLSRKGAHLEGLMRVAEALGLAGRALRLEPDQLDQLQRPCLLHWDLNHFVVLKSVSARRIVVHDPALGERRLSPEEFGRHFTGVALELSPAEGFTPGRARRTMPLYALMGRVRGLSVPLLQILTLSLGLEAVVIALPWYLQWVLDHALLAGDLDLLAVLALGFGALVVLQAGLLAVRGWWVASLGARMNFQWLGQVFAHLVKLPLDWFEKRHLGQVVSSMGSVGVIQRSLTTGVVQAAVDALMVLGSGLMLALAGPRLLAVSVVAGLLYAGLRAAVFGRLREDSADELRHAARQESHFLETAAGIQSLRLAGHGELRRAGWMNLLADQFNAGLRVQRLRIGTESLQTLVFGLERVLVVWLAARAVIDGQASVGLLVAVLAWREMFTGRLAALVDQVGELLMLRLHGERVADIVGSPVEPQDPAGALELDLGAQPLRLELRGVSYRYGDTEPWVLRDVDLVLEPGECLALTGPSGGGKTTLVKLLLGLLPPTEGEVLLDGRPLHGPRLAALRAVVGTVMQEDRLFSGSIADNIAFFDPEPDLARIEAVAALAAVDEEVRAMPMGWHTRLGEQGLGQGVSGGQRQRLLLARALYRQPRVLVLDEATSQLDLANEHRVDAAVRGLALTRLIVAHRPETIAMADRVLVLGPDGRIAPAARPGQAPGASGTSGSR